MYQSTYKLVSTTSIVELVNRVVCIHFMHMYASALNNTPTYTHVRLYVVWRVHPPPSPDRGMDMSIRSLSRLAIANHDQRIWNRWNQTWGRCWSRLQFQRFFASHVLWCYRGELFYSLMLCKQMTSLVDSTWVICQCWLCHVSKVVTGKINCCRIGYLL